MPFNVKKYAKKMKGGAQKDKAASPWPMPGDPSGAKKKIVGKLKGMKRKAKTTGTAYESKPKLG